MPVRLRAAAPGLLAFACAAALLAAPGPAGGEEKKPAEAKVSFAKDIQPLLAEKCGNCHGAKRPKKGLDFVTSYATTMKTVKAGKPDDSRLYKALVGNGARLMPPRKPLADEEVARVKAWIAAGAKNN